MQNKQIRFGPVALTSTLTTNILNCAITSVAGGVGITHSQPYILLRKLRIVSKTDSNVTFSLFLGATGANAAGTEVFGSAMPVAARSFFEWNGLKRMDSTDFLVGGASANTSLTIEGEAEIGFSG